ncbi:hypothetical protein [Haloarchaeobius litoreus]|uniref:Uncharacterized protein n=1 Tax=Haloarchaeobius litoreus TaxID=755306 RepID=A0ABD6DHX3_9EURY|nr:hypothetical protein [Haloarchaeobius litoreus]
MSFDLSGLRPSTETRTERFHITADANPVRAWLRTNCPEPVDPLGDAVEVQLFYDGDCGENGRTKIYPDPDSNDSWSTLNEFRRWLRGGLRLDDLDDQPCFDGTLCLDLDYRLRGDWAEDLSTELTFEVAAEQCRHVDEGSATSPFPPADCPELDCQYCVEFGKLDVDEDDDGRLYPRVYEFTELCSQFIDDGNTYALEVLEATNKEEDDETQETVCVSFRLLAGESWDALDEANAPAICSVAVKGGRLTESYEVDPPSTRTRGEVCTVTQDGDTATGALPAISNIVVSVCSESDTGDCFGPTDGPGGPPSQADTSDQRFEVSD